MSTPHNPRSLALLIDHYEERLSNSKLPFEIRFHFIATLCYYIALYNQNPIGKPVFIVSPLNLAA